ncbi:MAG TPA: hypothetical protein PLO68_09945, partial [Sedimentisphaerales bacterium]|nr:hypothetical protein [Sedimentisphaerales bacterium]
MRYPLLIASILFWTLPLVALGSQATLLSESSNAVLPSSDRRWIVQDLHITSKDVLGQKNEAGQHLLICREGFDTTVAGVHVAADRGVARIEPIGAEAAEAATTRYRVQIYLEGSISRTQTAALTDAGLEVAAVEEGRAVVLVFALEGEVFVTADKSEIGSPQGLLLYRQAVEAFDSRLAGESGAAPSARRTASAGPRAAKPEVGQTLSWSPMTDVPLTVEITREDGVEVTTIMGRLYAWWQQAAQGADATVYELEADSLVLWRHAADANRPGTDLSPGQRRGVGEIYVSGDVHLRQGQRTIRASELYYDFRNERGLIDDAVMRAFDSRRNIPIYIRAGRLRQVAANEFEAHGVTLTTSEFHTPQLSVTAEKVHVTDTSSQAVLDGGESTDAGFDVQMDGVRFKYYNA